MVSDLKGLKCLGEVVIIFSQGLLCRVCKIVTMQLVRDESENFKIETRKTPWRVFDL